MFLLCSYLGGRIMRSRRPVSRVLSSPIRSNDDGWPFIWGVRYRIPRRDLPGQRRGNPPVEYTTCRPYSVLLPVGFALPPPLPAARCAFTAPFHPYLLYPKARRRFSFCGTFPGVTPARRYLAPCLCRARTFLFKFN